MHGTHERAYVRARDGGRCRYCGRASWQGTVRFTLDHVVPRTRGGSSRPSNLVWACLPCNQAKGSRTVEEFLRDDPARLADLARQRRAPLAAAPKMGWVCRGLVRRLGEALQVRTTTGADTAWARRRWGVAKSHADDAACTGSTRPVRGLRTPAVLRAQGHGRRQQAKASKGEAYRQWRHARLPRGPAPGHAQPGRTVLGVRTGDTVQIQGRDGRWRRGRATVRPSQGTVSVRAAGRTATTRHAQRIRLESRARSWAQSRSP